jgi:hypothetical protein
MSTFVNTAQIYAACFGIALLSAGCAHQLRFRVVDAGSGKPVPNTSVKIRKGSSFEYVSRHPAPEQEIGQTDTNGMIAIESVSGKDEVYFSATGYRGAAAGFVGHGKIGIVPHDSYSVENPDTLYLRQKVLDSHGTITVPLSPL